MPTLHRLSKSKITMYAVHHIPPHFHVLADDGSEAWIELASLKAIHGAVPSAALMEALKWAKSNTALLTAKWKELNP